MWYPLDALATAHLTVIVSYAVIIGTNCLIPRLLTFLQVFMHRREHQERELGCRGYSICLEMYIANL